ncbi:molybdopterin-dependent oxidoreductase [Methanogenium marinum]|uniref:Molybdopterin-dependent oxidoreductase n=1 Tax=Methanogenium marinum TaxID=348610 RepID=A0A9Q4PWI6_9EURY|nr:molybdopterin-dependent oxidoreductase [Methanogenium marinum]MDE4908679.1 molybdopterin-dependent oxidoreductase [Methanogenium marinum]
MGECIIQRNFLRIVILCAIVAVIILYLFDISDYLNTDLTQSEELEGVEVRDYEGEDLSKISAFRENSIKGPQHISEEDYQLTISGLVNNTKIYSYSQILSEFSNYKKVVTIHCVEGWDVTILWEGALVKDIIEPSEILPSANTVIFTANDGYTTSFPLSYIIDNDIIMAYSMNNVTLPAERGFPFMLVAEDKWGYKWIKWITKIDLSDDENYRGYWEKRGYSDTGDLDRSFFD